MDEVGVEKTVILSQATGPQFDQIYQQYTKYPGRYEVWCGFDRSGLEKPDLVPAALKELERCHRLGARGVGELSDKGWGFGSRGTGIHADDPRMDPLFEKCAELGMPINIHVSDPIWAYEPMDRTNDGLMVGYIWRINDKQPGILGHEGLIESLERALQRHPKTTIIACHLANLSYDLTRLGQMLKRNPNLYVDVSARFAEIAPTPRCTVQFFQNNSDRVLYGTDKGYTQHMYRTSFRILESTDEHFYEIDFYNFHWPLYGIGLSDDILRNLYRENARKLLKEI
jgi:predicted TIM-barrel fold metal-dependent hydrolase